MKKRKEITLLDIAQKLGLSTAAVSKALSGNPGIGEQTRRKVNEAAAELGYDKRRKPLNGTVLEEGTSNPINVLLVVDRSNLADPHFAPIYMSLDRELKAGGCTLDLWPIDAELKQMPKLPIIKPHVYLLFGLIPEAFALKLFRKGVPAIAIDNEYDVVPHIDSIGANDYAGAFLAVKHLIDNGHRQIGFIGDNSLAPSFRQRGHGFMDAMQHYGLQLEERFIYDLRLRAADSKVDYYGAIHNQLDLENLPTAFFCANDPLAFCVGSLLTSRGISVPGKVSLIGFDNLEAAQWYEPPLTTIHFPRENVGTVVLETLRRRLSDPNGNTLRVLLNPRLVARSSVTSIATFTSRSARK
ncbi:LacI family DNA-binding transcriptional regulator [Cohnella soli]|uniref:LacI family DNA-binding transcriptional regulator n=1 Tax=Cohnella soli TaxID=425005 RepID=A0ABW0HRY5_9BACL